MRLRRFFGPLNACSGYPWIRHVLMLTPLMLILAALGMHWSWWGEPVRAAHEAAAAAHPRISSFMQLVSSWGTIPLYLAYFCLMIHGMRQPRADGQAHPDLMLARRCVAASLLICLAATQILKYSLGMPRPLTPWPPAPFSFSFVYNSFPSGHVTEVVGLAVPLSLRFRRIPVYAGLALLILLVGYSRIWLGWHHPLDLAGGLVMGSVCARLIMYCPAAPQDSIRQDSIRKMRPDRENPKLPLQERSGAIPSAKELP